MLKGLRTIIIMCGVAVVGVLETVNWVDVVPAGKEGIAATVVAILAMVLRAMTTTPVGKA